MAKKNNTVVPDIITISPAPQSNVDSDEHPPPSQFNYLGKISGGNGQASTSTLSTASTASMVFKRGSATALTQKNQQPLEGGASNNTMQQGKRNLSVGNLGVFAPPMKKSSIGNILPPEGFGFNTFQAARTEQTFSAMSAGQLQVTIKQVSQETPTGSNLLSKFRFSKGKIPSSGDEVIYQKGSSEQPVSLEEVTQETSSSGPPQFKQLAVLKVPSMIDLNSFVSPTSQTAAQSSKNAAASNSSVTHLPPQIKKRKDRLGNVINQGVQKRWQVTFRDMISIGQALGTYYEVESYKEHNKMDEETYKKEGWEQQYKMFKQQERREEGKNEKCCSIF